MTLGQGLYGLPEPQLPPRPPSRWRWVIRVVLCIAAFIIFSLTGLHFLGGNNDDLKQTLEQYLSQSSGYRATIGRLNAVSFFPLIGVDMDEVIYTDAHDQTVASLGHVNFSAGFWGISSGSTIHTVDIRNIFIAPGILQPAQINIDHLSIDGHDPKRPQLRLAGQYGGQDIAASVDLKSRAGMTGILYFGIKTPGDFTLTAGLVHAKGQVIDAPAGRQFRFDDLHAGKDGQVFKGSVSFAVRDKDVAVQGDVASALSQFVYKTTITHGTTPRHIDGTIQATRIDVADLTGPDGLVAVLRSFRNFLGGPCLSTAQMALNGSADHTVKQGVDSGPAKTTLSLRNDNAVVLTPPLLSVAAVALCASSR